MQHRIVEGLNDSRTFAERLDRYSKDGWVCQGGVAIQETAMNNSVYVQLMVKEDLLDEQ